ncbi:hypothetical protein QVD17_27562 [Tagetes erecta]|uniref:PGG domain-containing protein n=1 Tax=Tagetes erecta TaxID=13708 RepID=A0AAD8KB94_TARER|nr:hypothetical protein QVD17_27562 [Tagetes erecta]
MKGSSNTLNFHQETSTTEEGGNSIEIIIVPTGTETNNEDTQNRENMDEQKWILHKATIIGDWLHIGEILKKHKSLATEAISDDGNTVLHIAVGLGHNVLLKKLFPFINAEQLLQKRHSDGSTALHIAAIVGNKQAAELLVKKNSRLLQIQDNKGEVPLYKAYENMHLDTIEFLLKAVYYDGKSALQSFLARSVHHGVEIGDDLLVNAIYAKHYSLAAELMHKFPEFVSKSDDVLMAIAKSFPTGLNSGETLIYPSMNFCAMGIPNFVNRVLPTLARIPALPLMLCPERSADKRLLPFIGVLVLIATVPSLLVVVITFIINLALAIICLSLTFLYFLVWHLVLKQVPPFKHIERKKNQWEEAKEVLEMVCDEIDKLDYNGTHHPYYTRPILEASCKNANEVVDEILSRSREAIQSTDQDGYDIIQLAIIHRSERVYNRIYDIGERKNRYRTIVDSSRNNILHLAGRLASSSVLNQRTGAALQLQRELQWREEVKKLVFPTYITKENGFKETPDAVFTREHEKLVKEGEQWMKTTAESCSITAALITTIVFAAAITVPGGSNQEKGTPLFKSDKSFTIFAISDAISLFASTTALLVFLSILTTRFAEKDFLVSLPRRLFIGLFSLLLSTTAMMVAFSTTLFLVFCEQKPWMLAPICGLALIPIASFVTLQFPLMLDLFSSTYIPIFGKQRSTLTRRFNPNDKSK